MSGKNTKVCITCGERKPLAEFSPIAKKQTSRDGTGRNNRCGVCITNARMFRQSRSVEIFLRDMFTKSKSGRSGKFEWTIEIEDILDLWEVQDGRCALSGVYMTHHADRGERKDMNCSIDRIRSTEGYVKDNVQLVCQRVNVIKNDLDEASLYWWVKHIHDFSCD